MTSDDLRFTIYDLMQNAALLEAGGWGGWFGDGMEDWGGLVD